MTARRGRREHPLLRGLAGMVIGGAGGFATYWIGAALVASQTLLQMPQQQLPAEFSRPLFTFTYWEIVVVVVGMVAGVMVSGYRWSAPGVLGIVGLVALVAGYVAYALAVSIHDVPADQQWLSFALILAETGGLFLVLVSAFYSLDVATRKRWRRSPQQRPFDPAYKPKVAFQIPVFNEPPEVVEGTIDHALAQDYPRDRYTVYVADDSTDPELKARMAAYCAKVGAVHVTREGRRGFKAGALNHVTKHLPADVDLVAIVDADYWVDPDFLRCNVGHFVDTSLGFLQTPQDYRNQDESFLTRQYQRAEAYFYHAIMPSRNEENAIIFCGTMGIIRRAALEGIGGFAEDQICEDAEVSVRLVAAGWHSLYVDESFGRGLMPATFDAYKKQFHRWAFGNVRILVTRYWMILRSKMKPRQKVDFLVSNLHWFDGLFVMTIAGVLLFLGLGPVLGYDAVTHHQRELLLLALVPMFLIIDSFLRLHLVLMRAGHTRIRDAFLVQGMWFSIKVTTMVALVKSMLGFRSPFVRTPKHSGGRPGRFRALARSVRITWFETMLGTALVTVAVLDVQRLEDAPAGFVVLPVWLMIYALFFYCAPIYAYLSYRTLRPAGSTRGRPAPRTARPIDGTVQFVETRSDRVRGTKRVKRPVT